MEVRRLGTILVVLLGSVLLLSVVGLVLSESPGEVRAQTAVRASNVPRYVSLIGFDSANDCGNATSPCRTVQHAVDVAVDGDEVRVATGVYTGVHVRDSITQVVYISRTVTLRGGYGTDWSWNPALYTTTLDAGGVGRGMYVTGSITVTVEGLHITGGDALVAGGVEGAGVCIHNATVAISGSTIFSNTAVRPPITGMGGGLFCSDCRISLTDSVVSDNRAFGGGGLFLLSSQSDLVGNRVTGNQSIGTQSGGGGVLILGGSSILDSSVISGNVAGRGGGLLTAESSITLAGNSLLDNHASEGAGLYVESGNVLLVNTVVARNQVGEGGTTPGIYLAYDWGNDVGIDILHSTIAENTGGDGTALYIADGKASLANTIIASHTVGVDGYSALLDTTLWFGNGSNTGAGMISTTNDITGSPVFVDPAGWDYHIGPGSAAIDAGVDAGVFTDIDGDPRPLGEGFDIGADEYTGEQQTRVYLPLVLSNFAPGTLPGVNLLVNPGFEGIGVPPDNSQANPDNWTYDTFTGISYPWILTPEGWITWWSDEAPFMQPECKLVPNESPFNEYPVRIYQGYYSGLCMGFYKRMKAGYYQEVTGLTPGKEVEGAFYAHAWACNLDDPPLSCGDPEGFHFRVGIDPDGGTDPFSGNILWSAPHYIYDVYERVGPVAATVGLQGRVTFFMLAEAKWALKHNDAYWDNPTLVVSP